jgi:hypothetical protein
MLPQYKWNFVGLQQQYSVFQTNHPALVAGKPYEYSDERYLTLQAWGRYNIGKRYQLYAFVPYHYNSHMENGVTTISQGIGDVSFLLSRSILNSVGANFSHTLIAGSGIKTPTGAYTGVSELEALGLPNMQPGTGSWDAMANANYTGQHDKVGANLDATYMVTTTDKEGHKYGNRLSAGLLAFYTVTLSKVTVLPQLGMRYEYALHDYDNYSRRWLNEQSGGYLCFASAGLQAYYGRVGCRISYLQPVAQRYSSGYVTAGKKIDAGIFLLF